MWEEKFIYLREKNRKTLSVEMIRTDIFRHDFRQNYKPNYDYLPNLGKQISGRNLFRVAGCFIELCELLVM